MFVYGDDLRKVRFEHSTRVQQGKNRPEKTFRWEYLRGDGKWYSGDGGKAKPLYVNTVFRERDQVEMALALEGEAKADCLADLDIAAFSFRELSPESATNLHGVDVVIWPDADTVGADKATTAAKMLIQSARSVRIISPPAELSQSGDVIDALALGWDRTQVEKLIARATPFENKSGLAASVGNSPIGSIATYPRSIGEAAYIGIAGRFIRLIEEHTEADPNFLLVSFLTAAGNFFGRDAFIWAGGDKHHPKHLHLWCRSHGQRPQGIRIRADADILRGNRRRVGQLDSIRSVVWRRLDLVRSRPHLSAAKSKGQKGRADRL